MILINTEQIAVHRIKTICIHHNFCVSLAQSLNKISTTSTTMTNNTSQPQENKAVPSSPISEIAHTRIHASTIFKGDSLIGVLSAFWSFVCYRQRQTLLF